MFHYHAAMNPGIGWTDLSFKSREKEDTFVGASDSGWASSPWCDVIDLQMKQSLNLNTPADFMCSAVTAAMCHSVDNKAIKLHSTPVTPSLLDVPMTHEL